MTAQERVSLPGGAALTPGENALVSDRFMFSTIAFFLHTDLVLTNRRLSAVRPNTFLGLIPVGTNRSNFPIESIAGVSAGTQFAILGVVFGAVGLLFGLAALSIPGAAPFGVILVLLGLAAIIGAPKQAIEVMNSGGGVIRFPVSVFERSRTVEFANKVSEALARTTRGGLSPVTSQPPTQSTSEALKHLLDLRDQGLITDMEYSVKRNEILARL